MEPAATQQHVYNILSMEFPLRILSSQHNIYSGDLWESLMSTLGHMAVPL